MAFYAEMKRRRWYCVIGTNMIRSYRNKLYEDWYNSLTEEQKEYLAEKKRKKAEKAERECEQALGRLVYMTASLSGLLR